MKNKRSIEELLNSIYMLISEAKNEYESTIKIDNKSLKEIEKEVFLPNKLSKVVNDSEKIDYIKEKENFNVNELNKTKDFEKYAFEENSIPNLADNGFEKLSNCSNQFNELLTQWIDKNLKKLIEKELQIRVKNTKI